MEQKQLFQQLHQSGVIPRDATAIPEQEAIQQAAEHAASQAKQEVLSQFQEHITQPQTETQQTIPLLKEPPPSFLLHEALGIKSTFPAYQTKTFIETPHFYANPLEGTIVSKSTFFLPPEQQEPASVPTEQLDITPTSEFGWEHAAVLGALGAAALAGLWASRKKEEKSGVRKGVYSERLYYRGPVMTKQSQEIPTGIHPDVYQNIIENTTQSILEAIIKGQISVADAVKAVMESPELDKNMKQQILDNINKYITNMQIQGIKIPKIQAPQQESPIKQPIQLREEIKIQPQHPTIQKIEYPLNIQIKP